MGAVLTASCITGALAIQPATRELTVVGTYAWMPGLQALWAVDGLSAIFAALTAWISTLVTLYSWQYLPGAQGEHESGRREAAYYGLLAAFTGSMLGVVTAGQVLQLYFFWELTGIASFLLIGFWHADQKARSGSTLGLVLTVTGGLCLLVGLIVLGTATGSWTLSELLAGGPPEDGGGNRLALCTALILVGALAKSAQFPFFNWLPAAMAAPTPVSAYLHSSALVAAGVYLIARLFPVLSTAWTWQPLLIGAGVTSMILSSLLTFRQGEMKALLAYSTVAQYAFIFVGFGLASQAGAQAALYAFYVHALVKAALFLVAGAVTHVTGRTRFDELGGLARLHPVLGALATLSGLALGGIPLLGGFYYKEELLHAAHDAGADGLMALMLVGGMLTLFYMLHFLNEVFWKRPPAEMPVATLPVSMGLPIALLAALSAAAGIVPAWLNRSLLDPALSSILQRPATFQVELELGAVTLLSVVVLGLGLGLWGFQFVGLVPKLPIHRLPERISLGGRAVLGAYSWLGERALDLHSGNLRRYLRVILASAAILVAVSWLAEPPGDLAGRGEFDLGLSLVLVVALVANAGTIWLRHHVVAAISLAIAGFALGCGFALLHAPDVALAQVLVETLAAISIALALKMTGIIHPERTLMLTAGRKDWGRWAIAAGAGLSVAVATLRASRSLPSEPVAAWYVANAPAMTGMNDVVTAIVTEFRGLDTVVEILVFATAALAVMGLFWKAPGDA